MKTIQRTPHTETDINPSAAADKSAVRHVFTLGLDVDLRFVVTAIQCDQGVIPLARKLTRGQLVAWVKEKVLAGHVVHTVYECCGFGYTLHEQLTAAGAHSLLTTPMRLSLDRRRKNGVYEVTAGILRQRERPKGQRERIMRQPMGL